LSTVGDMGSILGTECRNFCSFKMIDNFLNIHDLKHKVTQAQV